jgi:hypothetical protein
LSNVVTYRFRVAATNPVGTGEPSEIVVSEPVSGTYDTFPPELAIVSVSPSTIAPGETLTAQWTVTDATGVGWDDTWGRWRTEFTLCSPWNEGSANGSLVSGSVTDGTFEATLEFPSDYAAQDWQVRIWAFDSLNNVRNGGCQSGYLTSTG